MKVDSSTPPAMPEIPLPKLSGVCERTDASTMLTHAKAPGNSQALFSLYMNDAHFFFVFLHTQWLRFNESMELDKFDRQLKLIDYLVRNTRYTLAELGERLGLSRRSMYRYIDFLRLSGFIIHNDDGIYSIDLGSPFIASLTSRVRFTGLELEAISNLLNSTSDDNLALRSLKRKFNEIYGVNLLSGTKVNRKEAANVERLYDAIARRRKVVIHSYASSNSDTVSDRLLEPFKFMDRNRAVRCYEPASDMCKTFNVGRIQGEVEVLDEPWEFTTRHINYYTDLFGFSSEHQQRVKLIMGRLATRVLMEEYLVDENQLVIVDDHHWMISLKVCGFKGIGRFYFGLFQDIEVVDSPEFLAYIRENLHLLTEKLKNP